MANRVSIRSVSLRSFRSFKKSVSIPLPENGLVNVRGKSGAGKSSVNLAIAYAFDYCPFPGTQLSSWGEDLTLEIGLELDTSEGLATLIRGKSPSLTINGETVKGGAKAVAERLKQLCGGLTPDMLEALTFRGQRKPGLFLSKTDAEKKEFLTSLLGINRYEESADATRKIVSELESKLEIANSIFVHAEKQLAEDRAALQNPDLRPVPSTAREESALNSAMEALEALKTEPLADTKLQRLRAGYASCQERVKRLETVDRERQTARERAIRELQRSIAEDRLCIQRIEALASKLENCKLDIESIRAHKCPTCNQHWNEKSALDQKLREQVELEAEVAAKQLVLAIIGEKELELANIAPYTPDPGLVSMRDMAQDMLIAIKEEESRITSASREKILSQESEVARLRLALQDVKARADMALAHNVAQSDIHTRQVQRMSLSETRMMFAASELESLQTRLSSERDYIGLVGNDGFLGCIFDEILAEISDEVNRILAGVPNVSHCTLEFKSEHLTQKGTTKKAIVPIVTIGGYEAPLESGCSGGMASVIELATDLAVGAVISRRTGFTPGWLVLDECFDGLGTRDKEMCLDMLRQYATDRLVLVVDHGSEFKELFRQVITVDIQNGESVVL